MQGQYQTTQFEIRNSGITLASIEHKRVERMWKDLYLQTGWVLLSPRKQTFKNKCAPRGTHKLRAEDKPPPLQPQSEGWFFFFFLGGGGDTKKWLTCDGIRLKFFGPGRQATTRWIRVPTSPSRPTQLRSIHGGGGGGGAIRLGASAITPAAADTHTHTLTHTHARAEKKQLERKTHTIDGGTAPRRPPPMTPSLTSGRVARRRRAVWHQPAPAYRSAGAGRARAPTPSSRISRNCCGPVLLSSKPFIHTKPAKFWTKIGMQTKSSILLLDRGQIAFFIDQTSHSVTDLNISKTSCSFRLWFESK